MTLGKAVERPGVASLTLLIAEGRKVVLFAAMFPVASGAADFAALVLGNRNQIWPLTACAAPDLRDVLGQALRSDPMRQQRMSTIEPLVMTLEAESALRRLERRC